MLDVLHKDISTKKVQEAHSDTDDQLSRTFSRQLRQSRVGVYPDAAFVHLWSCMGTPSWALPVKDVPSLLFAPSLPTGLRANFLLERFRRWHEVHSGSFIVIK